MHITFFQESHLGSLLLELDVGKPRYCKIMTYFIPRSILLNGLLLTCRIQGSWIKVKQGRHCMTVSPGYHLAHLEKDSSEQMGHTNTGTRI